MPLKGNGYPEDRSRSEMRRDARDMKQALAMESVRGLCPYCGRVPSSWEFEPRICCRSCGVRIRNGHEELWRFAKRTESGQSVQIVSNVSALAKRLEMSRSYLYKILRQDVWIGKMLRTKFALEKYHLERVWPRVPIETKRPNTD